MPGPSAPLSAGRVHRPDDPIEERKKAAWRALLVLRKMSSLKEVADQMSQRAAQAMMKSWNVPDANGGKATQNQYPHALSLESALVDSSRKTTLFLDALVANRGPGPAPSMPSLPLVIPPWPHTPGAVSAVLPYCLAVRLSPVPEVCDRELQANFSRLGVERMTRISGLEICLHSRSLPIIANLLNLHGKFSGLQVRLDTPMRWDGSTQHTELEQNPAVRIYSNELPRQDRSREESPEQSEDAEGSDGVDPEATMQRLMSAEEDVDARAMTLLCQLLDKSEAQQHAGSKPQGKPQGRAAHRPKIRST